MDYRLERQRLVDWLRRQMIGPANESGILHGIQPLERYPCAQLYPVINDQEGIDPASLAEDDDESQQSSEEVSNKTEAEPASKPRRYVAPSAVGFSFFAKGASLEFHVRCSAVRYGRAGDRDEKGRYVGYEFQRISLGGDEQAVTFTTAKRVDVLLDHNGEYLAGLDVQWRPYADGSIITVSLFNKQTWSTNEEWVERSNRTLFEVSLHCFIDQGEVGDYPRVEYSLLNDEEQELELQYKHRRIYAIGHGAAADWREKNGKVNEIYTDFMPTVEVPQVTADVAGKDNKILQIAYLANCTQAKDEVLKGLENFVSEYADWVAGQIESGNHLSGLEGKAAKRITKRMEQALQRIRTGISLLRNNATAFLAFSKANQAMLDQMRQVDSIKNSHRAIESYAWRPFQLAFVLTVLESAINEESDFRDTVDLIWFPTGGGKTEAYLGLIAFLIVYRRLTNTTAGGGTVVLMRYTLRLLTSQQYLRAARLICALEIIRQSMPSLGNEPISIGMWVGSATSPNTFEKAMEQVSKIAIGKTEASRSLVLDSCPWCGQRFTGPENYIANENNFRFCCSNSSCDFGKAGSGIIPCNVVDEALYKEPPTLLVATIDKFARLAWEERANAFLGGSKNKPPELIIQDELHLIAGALGSVAGIYEAALDSVLQLKGCYPKYVASTATIRMAEEQVRRIYGSEVAVFPPPGLSCDDSYFAKTVDLSVRPGRLYMGYFAPLLDKQHCMAPLAASLLAAPESVFDEGQRNRDLLLEAWWSQVVYHGSLKGVGNSHNSFNIDVRDLLARFQSESAENGNKIQRALPKIDQLTSISTPEKNAQTFARLELNRDHEDCIDAVLATNMVSVGLDVSRLALMVINGQPLTTAEYIQASSRVGRGTVPGLVCVNFYRNSARNLSHYENFRPYHESFYRFVEPTSVTPYTYQARLRALHAALVIAVRHGFHSLLPNDSAAKFDPADQQIQKVIQQLKRRCVEADPDRKVDIINHIDKLVLDWKSEVDSCVNQRRQLNYQSRDNEKNNERLLYNHTDTIRGLWPTLQSMRNVEETALLKSL